MTTSMHACVTYNVLSMNKWNLAFPCALILMITTCALYAYEVFLSHNDTAAVTFNPFITWGVTVLVVSEHGVQINYHNINSLSKTLELGNT